MEWQSLLFWTAPSYDPTPRSPRFSSNRATGPPSVAATKAAPPGRPFPWRWCPISFVFQEPAWETQLLGFLGWGRYFLPSNYKYHSGCEMLRTTRYYSRVAVVTYLPHKAVAEVSKDKEPIGRDRAEFNWFESQLMSDSIELRVKWFGCHLIWDSNDFGCQLIWDSADVVWFEIQMILVVNRCVLQMILVVCWCELQVMRLSIDLRFKWFGCQFIWDLVVNRFESQMSWLSIDLRFKWFGCQMIWGSSDLVVNWCVVQMILSNEAFLRDFLQNWSFEAPKRSFSARLPSKLKLWSSKTKLFCETSFKNVALKLKNKAFLRDFLKLKLSRWKTKLFCETSFKIEALKIKNEAFLRDFLQNWHVEQTLDLRIPIRFRSF